MAWTRSNLLAHALETLGKVEAGQDPAAEDLARVAAILPGKIAELRRRGIVDIPDDDDVPDELGHWLAVLVGQDAAPGFVMPMNADMIALAELRIRQIVAEPPGDEPVPALYF